eukprot:PITA_23770
MGWKIHQMDVKTTFLNEVIEEEVYIEQPEGFETFDRESHLCRLKRALSCKEDLARDFELKYVGLMKDFLGLEVWQIEGELFVSQGNYGNDLLPKFHMGICKPMQTPLEINSKKEDATLGEEVDATMYRKLVGSLMYLVSTQSDMCYGVNQLSQAKVRPTKLFWRAVKRVLRYLRGTTKFGLCYRRT